MKIHSRKQSRQKFQPKIVPVSYLDENGTRRDRQVELLQDLDLSVLRTPCLRVYTISALEDAGCLRLIRTWH